MVAEAQIICERSDQILFKSNIIKVETLNKQPGLVTYLNWRLKTIHSFLSCQFGAFVQSKDQFKVNTASFYAESKDIGEKFISILGKEVLTHVWDTIVCPVILSLIKQLDRLTVETVSSTDSYIEMFVGMLQKFVMAVPDSNMGKTQLVKKFHLVAAQACLRLQDYDRTQEHLQKSCELIMVNDRDQLKVYFLAFKM